MQRGAAQANGQLPNPQNGANRNNANNNGGQQNPAPNLQIHQPRREPSNDYAALFVALIGEVPMLLDSIEALDMTKAARTEGCNLH